MKQVEQFSLLIAFFMLVVMIGLGLWQAISYLPELYHAPSALLVVALLVYGVCRVLRGGR
jgi:hypothetical protein